MLQRFDKPRLGMFLIPLLLITLLQMMVQQARAANLVSPAASHPCAQVEDRDHQDMISDDLLQAGSTCCETQDCHNPACQNLCTLGTAVTAPGFSSVPFRHSNGIYHTFPVALFSDALATPPFHPPRLA